MSSSKSKSKSSQSSVSKDNSAIVEDDGINVTDGGMGARDNAVVAGGSITGNDTVENNALGIGGNLSNYKGTQNITIERVDTELVSQGLDVVNDTVDAAFGFGGDVVAKFDGLTQATIEANSRTTDKVIAGLFDEAEEARESDELKTLQTLGIYLSIATGIVTLGKIFS